MLLCFLLYKLVRTTRPLGLRSVCVGVSVDSRRIVRLSALLSPYGAPPAPVFCGQGVPPVVLGGLRAARVLWWPTDSGTALLKWRCLSTLGRRSPSAVASPRRSAPAKRAPGGVGQPSLYPD